MSSRGRSSRSSGPAPLNKHFRTPEGKFVFAGEFKPAGKVKKSKARRTKRWTTRLSLVHVPSGPPAKFARLISNAVAERKAAAASTDREGGSDRRDRRSRGGGTDQVSVIGAESGAQTYVLYNNGDGYYFQAFIPRCQVCAGGGGGGGGGENWW